MKKLLQKISWRTRKWNLSCLNLEFKLLCISLHDGSACWGFSLFTINKGYRKYSLISFEFRLPNGADRKYFDITDWDILFLHNYLWKQYDDLSDNKLWAGALWWWDETKLKILNKIFK